MYINLQYPLLLTGHSGFFGQILSKELEKHFQVQTLGRSEGSEILCNLAEAPPSLSMQYEMVVHNAGKAHIIPRTASEKEAFFQVNTKGTQHLLKALDQSPGLPNTIIYISTVSVYGLDEGEAIAEDAPLLGQTPYALSKIQAEDLIQEWAAKNGVNAVILRPPLIVGLNPPGSLAAMRKAMERGYYVQIKGNQARKSAVLGADMARLIPTVRGKSGIFNLTDRIHPYFWEFEAALAKSLKKRIHWSLPLNWLKMGAQVGAILVNAGVPFPLNQDRLQKMTATLTFSDEKARKELGWNPQPVIPYLQAGLFDKKPA